MNIRAITIAVDYSDCLRITLPYVRHNFSEYIIVTTPKDAPNVLPIANANDARVLTTDLFYANGGIFRKWLALEWGLDQIGRKGWLCILDADILWPKVLPTPLERILQPGLLCTPLRRMYPTIPLNASDIPCEEVWNRYPIHRNLAEFAGYCQLFNASDPVLGNPPWHQTDWIHAGGADSAFQAKWNPQHKIRPLWNVLHLGSAGENWCGRSTAYADGSVPPEADARRNRVKQIWIDRRGKRGMDAFRNERYGGDVDLPQL